jgi:hypothetical protein
MRTTLEEIKTMVERLGNKISAPQSYMPTFGSSNDNAHPHVIMERGQEIRRDFAVDMDDLLFRIFSDITHAMASTFELQNRIAGQDFRRQLFSKQQELMGILNNEWQTRKKKDHDYILMYAPFS